MLQRILPSAEVHHVGSTALLGALTKGDLDIQVRVSREDFDASAESLQRHFAVLEGGFEPPDGMSFKDESTTPELGIHLTVVNSEADVQWVFCEMLAANALLRAEYDEIKRRHRGRPMEDYRDAKEDFFAKLRASPQFESIRRGARA